MRYEEPVMEIYIFLMGDVITGSPDLGDYDSGGSGNGNEGVEYTNIQ